MESIDLKSLNLTIEESRDIIDFIAKKRGISTEELLSTIKPNLKRKNNEILTTKTQQKAAKIHQKAAKTHEKIKKNTTSSKNTTRTNKNTTKSSKNTTRTNKNTTRTNKNTTKIT